MPRVFDEHNDPFDYCNDCMPTYEEAVDKHGPDLPNDPENYFEHDGLHPPYEEQIEPYEYHCEECDKRLTARDNSTYHYRH